MHDGTSQHREWLGIGVEALDTAEGRVGVAQLFRDHLGSINGDRPISGATHVLLRPVGSGHRPWWARIADVERPPSRDLGLLHETHPLLGRLVVDTGTGRVGVLRAIVRDVPGGERRAWLRPEGGGVEWAAAPEALAEFSA